MNKEFNFKDSVRNSLREEKFKAPTTWDVPDGELNNLLMKKNGRNRIYKK